MGWCVVQALWYQYTYQRHERSFILRLQSTFVLPLCTVSHHSWLDGTVMQVVSLLKPETFSSACSFAHTSTRSLCFPSVPVSDIIPTLFSAAGPLTASLPPPEQAHAAFARIPLPRHLARSLCIPLLPPLFLPSRFSGCCMFPVSPSLALPLPIPSCSLSLPLTHCTHSLYGAFFLPLLLMAVPLSLSHSLSLTYSLAGTSRLQSGLFLFFSKSTISTVSTCVAALISDLIVSVPCFICNN